MTTSMEYSPESEPSDTSKAGIPSAKSANEQDVPALLKEFGQLGMTSQKYVVEDKLAAGGMGIIYKAFDRGLTRQAALKMILPEIAEDQAQLGYFIQEARITGQLEHPNVVPVHDIGVTDDGRPFFSMKRIQGEELLQIIRQLHAKDPVYETTYSLFKLLTICRKVCDAVAFAHSKNYIHRDIKPDNIIVGDYGEVLLMDWGLARPAGQPDPAPVGQPDTPQEGSSLAVNLTQSGEIKGTPNYMAPEQARGDVDLIDTRTDIFLLGATLYTVATLTLPYAGRNVYTILDQAEKGRFIPPQQRAPQRHIPDALNHIIMKCMAYDPADRYPSVAELIKDLDAFMAGEAVTEHRSFAKDAVLMREGEGGHEAYVILSGLVEVSKSIADQSVSLMQLGPGDAVGEMALISNTPRSATATALADTEVVVINAELVQQALEKLPPWMGRIVQALTNRLRESNEHVHPLIQGDCTWHVLHQLQMMYPLYAKNLATDKGQSHRPVMALPYQETIQDIARNLCLDTLVIARIVQGLCQSGMLNLLDTGSVTIPNYQGFCQFVDFVRDKMGYTAHLQTEPTVVSFVPPAHAVEVKHEEIATPLSQEEIQASFQTLRKALQKDLG
jgi:serine/threonine protein kinase